MKDYYKILGVIRTAEDVVIRAAYRALAQKYHPDKFDGSAEAALRMMQEINEAYAVLSDIGKRNEYNSDYDKQENDSFESEENEVFNDEIDNIWSEAIEYFPDLIDISNSLSKISKNLVHTFKYHLIETKEFEKRILIAKTIETLYLKNYFGLNDEIIKFGKALILCRFKNHAKKLNRAVNILGSNIDSKTIINKILKDELDCNDRVLLKLIMNCNDNARIESRNILNNNSLNIKYGSYLAAFNAEISVNENFDTKYVIYIDDISSRFMSKEELKNLINKLANAVV